MRSEHVCNTRRGDDIVGTRVDYRDTRKTDTTHGSRDGGRIVHHRNLWNHLIRDVNGLARRRARSIQRPLIRLERVDVVLAIHTPTAHTYIYIILYALYTKARAK
jgi:hypothetical protein